MFPSFKSPSCLTKTYSLHNDILFIRLSTRLLLSNHDIQNKKKNLVEKKKQIPKYIQLGVEMIYIKITKLLLFKRKLKIILIKFSFINFVISQNIIIL